MTYPWQWRERWARIEIPERALTVGTLRYAHVPAPSSAEMEHAAMVDVGQKVIHAYAFSLHALYGFSSGLTGLLLVSGEKVQKKGAALFRAASRKIQMVGRFGGGAARLMAVNKAAGGGDGAHEEQEEGERFHKHVPVCDALAWHNRERFVE
jgi:hypothetical protein